MPAITTYHAALLTPGRTSLHIGCGHNAHGDRCVSENLYENLYIRILSGMEYLDTHPSDVMPAQQML